jgi:hypothetical protein
LRERKILVRASCRRFCWKRRPSLSSGSSAPGFAEEAEFGAPFQEAEVVLVAGGEPVGEVFGVEGDALVGEGLADGFVGGAAIEEAIDEVALSFGELGDFAFGPGGDFGLLDGVDDGSLHSG